MAHQSYNQSLNLTWLVAKGSLSSLFAAAQLYFLNWLEQLKLDRLKFASFVTVVTKGLFHAHSTRAPAIFFVHSGVLYYKGFRLKRHNFGSLSFSQSSVLSEFDVSVFFDWEIVRVGPRVSLRFFFDSLFDPLLGLELGLEFGCCSSTKLEHNILR